MGQELINIFEKAEKYGKMDGRIKLATITTISSDKASRLPDTPELINKFLNALKQVEKEYRDQKALFKQNYQNVRKKLFVTNFSELTKVKADVKSFHFFENEFYLEKTMEYTFPYFYCSN